MLKMLGGILVTAGSAAIGFYSAAGLYSHIKILTRIISALRYMKSEIGFTLAPIPDLTQRLAERERGATGVFFGRCNSELSNLGEKTFGEIWSECADATLKNALKEDEIQTFKDLGELLGRYDSQEQALEIERAAERFDFYLQRAEQDKIRLGKLYGAMGVLCGIAVVIILI